ncbi:MAG: hypothetical protein AAFV38_01130 [Pseudomonadota bacterium]
MSRKIGISGDLTVEPPHREISMLDTPVEIADTSLSRQSTHRFDE